MPTVAIGDEFLDAFARIPRVQQRKVREFIDKFKLDPTSAAINYEKIHAVKDDKVRTVRIDLKYRAVVLQPPKGDVYVLVWVDNHDEAMDWARSRTFEVNPRTGALQVLEVAVTAAPQPTDDRVASGDLFADFADDRLLSFGLPAVLLPAADLADLGPHLPSEAAEALMWLADGIPPEEVLEAVRPAAGRPVDPNDLARALEHPDSKRRFVSIRSDEDLTAMLEPRWPSGGSF